MCGSSRAAVNGAERHWVEPQEAKDKEGISSRLGEYMGEEHRRAFNTLKDILAHPEFLLPPETEAKTKLVTDSRNYSLKAVLLQVEGPEDGWRAVEYASRKQKGAEIQYTVTEKECMAGVLGLRKFRSICTKNSLPLDRPLRPSTAHVPVRPEGQTSALGNRSPIVKISS